MGKTGWQESGNTYKSVKRGIMKYLPLICLLFLFGCKSTVPSTSIANQVISDLNAHQKAIEQLDKQVTKECKSEVFVATLNSLKAQTNSISGQVKSISNACKVEKEVLEGQLTIRNIIIMVLVGILLLILFLRSKILG